ncbi:AFR497Cp [Eremothecium gossypii ATCC 10895]|uniref:SWR1-complex protein 4 n=1 Tax=Eremothecium gossypii (strain ATCC 10895 / CBS 109.51 / FGSC 9923 / NRRL Y-1056) TaxID=284811 RepID=SWC4_EREGS|nr:AFR497Cp [Eremothecium gossypii ATCC 10895]Q752S6.1 RecName: Full=SWR1-complex protein 4 [Eremothecium gossypii ATCC 10895]AAS53868.1 AFR497Cp [Eremothecium gossypii ATCC 10895]AEY98181.1 FAFR497Cp [Eremothecium gossypii FDAG1]
MSSSDIFDVLNIQPKSSSPHPQTSQSNAGASKTPKPQVTGMQRELYNLLGDNTPPIVIQPTSKFKDRLASLTKPSPWTHTEFEATPYVKLSHWVKGSKELLEGQSPKSSFAKYDQKLTLPEFTEGEYQEFMAQAAKGANSDAPTWSYEEVQYLFDLCRRYDLRWHIVYDRYMYDESRTMEDIREMFYTVCQKYFQAKDPGNPLLPSLAYSKDQEIQRKKYLTRLLSRSAAEIAEEEALIMESRKFEMAAKKTLQEREAMLRLLDHPQGDANVSQFLTSQGMNQLYNNLLNDKQRRRKPDSAPPENPWMKQQQQFAQQKQQLQLQHQQHHQLRDQKRIEVKTDPVTPGSPKQDSPSPGRKASDQSAAPRMNKKQKLEMQTAMRRKQDSEYAQHLLKNFSSEERKSLGVTLHGEKLAPGVFLRSSKISTFKPSIQNKVVSVLQELGLPVRPAMPSAAVVQHHDELLRRIVTLLDLKRQQDKLEAEKAIVK